MKDAQNPYRTGVLIDNHVEDRFGQELAQNYVRATDSNWTETLHDTIVRAAGQVLPGEQRLRARVPTEDPRGPTGKRCLTIVQAEKEQQEYEKMMCKRDSRPNCPPSTSRKASRGTSSSATEPLRISLL